MKGDNSSPLKIKNHESLHPPQKKRWFRLTHKKEGLVKWSGCFKKSM